MRKQSEIIFTRRKSSLSTAEGLNSLAITVKQFDIFDYLVLFFFITLHADQLNLTFAGVTLRLNNIVGLFLLSLVVLRYKKPIFKIDTPFFFALLGITFSLSISCVLSPHPLRCLLFIGWWGMTVLCYVCLPFFLVSFYSISRIFVLYGLSFLVVGLYAAAQLLLSGLGLLDPFAQQHFLGHMVRPNAFCYEPSFYALHMTPFIVSVHLLYLARDRRVSLRTVLFVLVLFLLSTASTALVSLLLFWCGYIMALNFPSFRSQFRFGKRPFLLILGFTLCTAGIFAVFPNFARLFILKLMNTTYAYHDSVWERLTGMKNCWILFLEHPFFGVGLGGVPAYLLEAWQISDDRFLSLFQPHHVDQYPSLFKHFEPSNVTTELLASLGIFGAAAFLFLVGLFFYRVREALYKGNDEERKWIWVGAFSVIVLLLVLQINQGLLRTYVWTHFSFCYALTSKISYRLTTHSSLENKGKLL